MLGRKSFLGLFFILSERPFGKSNILRPLIKGTVDFRCSIRSSSESAWSLCDFRDVVNEHLELDEDCLERPRSLSSSDRFSRLSIFLSMGFILVHIGRLGISVCTSKLWKDASDDGMDTPSYKLRVSP